MSKPHIFIGSTYYDLSPIRSLLESLIDSLGYEAVLLDSGDVAFRHDQLLDESWHDAIRSCHLLVLIIGRGYRGALSSSDDRPDPENGHEKLNSITIEEYETARERDVPIFICVDKGILAEYEHFKENREGVPVSGEHVDGLNVFHLLDRILRPPRNQFVHGFERFNDISFWLPGQWAELFADLLMKKPWPADSGFLEGQEREFVVGTSRSSG